MIGSVKASHSRPESRIAPTSAGRSPTTVSSHGLRKKLAMVPAIWPPTPPIANASFVQTRSGGSAVAAADGDSSASRIVSAPQRLRPRLQ